MNLNEDHIKREVLENGLLAVLQQLYATQIDAATLQALQVLEPSRYSGALGEAQANVRMFEQKVRVIKNELSKLPPIKTPAAVEPARNTLNDNADQH